MSDEIKLIRESQRADHAKRLLSDDLFNEAFKTLEQTYIDEMINSGVAERDTYARDRLHQAIHILRKVKGHLESVFNNGKVAKAELNDLEGKRKNAA